MLNPIRTLSMLATLAVVPSVALAEPAAADPRTAPAIEIGALPSFAVQAEGPVVGGSIDYRFRPLFAAGLRFAYATQGVNSYGEVEDQYLPRGATTLLGIFARESLPLRGLPIELWLQEGIDVVSPSASYEQAALETDTQYSIGTRASGAVGLGVAFDVVSNENVRLSLGPAFGLSAVFDPPGFNHHRIDFLAGLDLRLAFPLAPGKVVDEVPYVLVLSRLVERTNEREPAEITETPAYLQELPHVSVVALRAPDYCASQTAANATGAATQTGRTLQTSCGVEMGELERVLTRAGFVVRSWKILESMVRDEHLTPLAAAQKLGAQVLFQVNSLERVRAEPDREARWERRYFRSDRTGTQGAPLELPEHDLAELRRMVSQHETLGGDRRGAMLDVNAILVQSGQTIWFYRWQRLETARTERERRELARRVDEHWVRSVPEDASAPAEVEDRPRSVEVDQSFRGGRPESVDDAAYFGLIREVVQDFVGHFAPQGARAATPVTTAPSAPACSLGQSITEETGGHCCWPAQVWSNARKTCVGVPECPAGFRVAGQSCETTR